MHQYFQLDEAAVRVARHPVRDGPGEVRQRLRLVSYVRQLLQKSTRLKRIER